MERHLWRKVDNVIRSTSRPCPRWGHTCCVIGDEVVFFGGYADSNYMNDVWTYNSITMKWEEIITKGDKPTYRSNCSMNYDKENNKIVIFGGGGSNKQRFNSISVLDWKSKEWIEINPRENEAAPWERTYHTAQLKFPYLIVYGGEGMTDLEDLWVFNFQTLSWKEVTFPQNAIKPCARRFHSSALIGNEMFVIAGCYGKYRCLSDIYSLDLTPLLTTGKTDGLKWRQRKMKGNSFLTRWGHSSVAFENKIYIFGGRFSNDLNDLLVADTTNDTLRTIKTGSSQAPKPRRRHCAGFVGSSMVTFGGFNGEYFNDLFYINVYELTAKVEYPIELEQKYHEYLLGNNLDLKINCLDQQIFYGSTGLVSKYFETEEYFYQFVQDCEEQYTKSELEDIFLCIYKGEGNLELKVEHLYHKNKLYQAFSSLKCKLKKKESKSSQILAKAVQKANQDKNQSHVTVLPQRDFLDHIDRRNRQWYSDSSIIVGSNRINVNSAELSLNSSYFRGLFSEKFKESKHIQLGIENLSVFEILLDFLSNNNLQVPEQFAVEDWMDLCEMSDYFCLPHLKSICEFQLCSKITMSNLEELLKFSSQLGLKTLELHCVDLQFKDLTSRPGFKFADLNAEINKPKKESKLNCKTDITQLFHVLKFDLQHSQFLKCTEVSAFLKKKESESTATDEKENRESNFI